MSKNIALVLAGGKGLRMNREIPKQFIDIKEKPLIVHSLETLDKCDMVEEALIVCIESHMELMREICEKYGIKKVTNVISGGNTRHESICHGVTYLSETCEMNSVILIHNANMPLVTEENIRDCLIKGNETDTIATSVAKNNGYFYCLKNDKLVIGPDRKEMLSAKVPEAARLRTMNKLYNDPKFSEKKYESYTAGMLGILDDLHVVPVYCESTNFKITTEADYLLADKYLEMIK